MISILSGIDHTSAALNAERVRMDVVSQNIANVNTMAVPGGKAYQRRQVVFEAALNAQLGGPGQDGNQTQPLRIKEIQASNRPDRLVYQPGHVNADANGMVTMPNINIHEEMIDLMSASRTYEANLNVVKTARSMALQTLSLGKR